MATTVFRDTKKGHSVRLHENL